MGRWGGRWGDLAHLLRPHPLLTYYQLEVIQVGKHVHHAGAECIQLLDCIGPVCPLSQDTLVGPLLFTVHMLQ